MNKYFVWKYTDPRRYASTTKHFKNEYGGNRAELDNIVRGLFTFDLGDIAEGLSRASEIKGLGIAGASGLLALLFPEYFGTVDQFVVKALQSVSTLDQIHRVLKMNPQGLTLSDGVVLVSIMRRKARELNAGFNSTFWTPRKIDVILWAVGH